MQSPTIPANRTARESLANICRPVKRQSMTAIEKYRKIKSAFPGSIALFPCGDFVELFGDDAVRAGRVLGLSITTRYDGFKMAGFPRRTLEGHIVKIVKAGFRVCVCEERA